MNHFWLSVQVVVLFLFVAAGARAQEEISCEGPLQGDELRYPNARVVERTWNDLAAVPASVVAWDGGDWLRFSAFAAPTIGLMLPTQPSLDVRLQSYISRHERPWADKLFVKIQTIPEGVFLAAYGAALFSAAYVRDDDKLFEYGTLSLEALGIEQFYHVTMKLLIGRESPYQGNHQGEVYGPTKVSFPGGTPSGHAATYYAMMAVLMEYWDKRPLYVLGHLGGLFVSASLVYERQHFLSDVIFGAGMGYYIGRWIVRHRSSRYRCRPKGLAWYQRMMWLPLVSGKEGLGLAASYRY